MGKRFKKLRSFLKWFCCLCLLVVVGTAVFLAVRPEGQFTVNGQAKADGQADGTELKVLTWNVQRGKSEGSLQMGWDKRKQAFSEILKDSDYDVLCFQEVLAGQLEFFAELLDGYGYVAKGRADGKSAGEHGPIFYRKDRLELVKTETFWLSATPDVPSKGWGEGVNRICTWAEFTDKQSGRRFRVYNTHLHLHPYAQYRGAKLLAERVQLSDVPVILTGDLNAPSDWPALDALKDAGLSSAEASGALTYHVKGKGIRCLDHILFSKGWSVRQGGIIKQKAAGVYPSDHFGLWAELKPEK